MSIRRKLEKAIPVLLAHLEKAKECVIGSVNESNKEDPLVLRIQEIENELEGIRDYVWKISNWEKSVLEQDLDDDVFEDRKSDKTSDKLDQIKPLILKELICKFDLHIT
ncbi:Uncharacterized protein Adt_39793 [Abeliophyllum distichum]|uniref:Uncharacterized protein n=1 Tax=Abeliophyllum distichum TaxID=126358 RepID=A0ABD1Q646_9LAMI